MMQIRVVAVGKLRARYLEEGCAEYQKRLGAYCRGEWVELREQRLDERPSPAEIKAALDAEGRQILERAAQTRLVALCVEGQALSSGELAEFLRQSAATGHSAVSFAVGSSYGLSDEVKRAADLKLSLSRMTLPHQLARLVLYEQLYRAFSILAGAKYHK